MSGASSASQAAALAAFRAKKDPTQDDLSAKAPPKRPMPLRVNTDVGRQKSTSTTVISSTPLSAKPISGKSATAKSSAISVSKVGMKSPATKSPKSAGTKGASTEGSDGTRLQYSSSTASNISSIPRKNLIKSPTPVKPSLAGGAALFASMSVAPTVVPSISAVALAAGKTAAENMPQTPTHNEYLNSYNDRKQADPPSASSHNYTSSNFNSSSNINPTNPKSPHSNRSPDASPRAQSGRTQPSSRRDSFTSNSDLESTYSKSSVVVALAAAAAASVSSLKPRSNVESKPRLSESTNRLSSYDPKEMIKQVKESINSKATKSKASSEESTQKNQALLEGLRKSIDSKRISRQIPSNLAFQSSDDVRRHSYQNSLNFPILSSTNVSSSAVSHDSAYGHGFGSIDNGDAPNGVFNQPYYNNSYSSLESATSVPSYAHSGTPVIVVGPQLPDVGGITGTFDTSLRSSAEDLSKDEPPKQRKGVISADSPPIQVPASSLVVARSQSAGSSETLPHPMHRIPLQRTISNNKSLTIPDEAGKSKLKRKPPPGNYEHPLTPKDEYFGFETDFKKPGMLSPQSGYLSSKSSLANTDEFEYSTDQDGDAGTQEEHDQDDRSTRDPDFAPLAARNNKVLPQSNSLGKFPQFPDIDARRSGQDHSLFKRKHKAKGSVSASNFGSDFEDEGEYSDDDIQEEGPGSSSAASLAVPMVPSGANSGGSSGGGSGSATPARPLTPVLPQKTQTVRMKTTMRKTNKRKDKKLLFNENKPWKNHNELNYITEQERKRYEGVWVSNRGSYINCVVTGLVGVDYDQINNPPLEKEEEVEVPLKAALLSAQANKFDPKNVVDHQNFHNLKSAEVNQLMHGLVIKRLWMRSRLPSETLATIWNLVDFRLDGTLNKQEFLVGMWLVDQCLYGRKIPKKVDDTIWDSLGSIGVNVVIKKKGRR